MMKKRDKISVLMIDISQIPCPLDNTLRKKFTLFSEHTNNYYVAFSKDSRFRRFSDLAEFYLIPSQIPFVLKHLLFGMSVLILTIYLVMRKGITVIITTTPLDGFPVAVAKVFLKICGKKVIAVMQAQGDWEKAPVLLKKYPRFYTRFMNLLSDIALRSADMIRAVSVHTAGKVKSKVDKPCLVFSSFTDFEIFHGNGSGNGSHSGTRTILYAGALTQLKGVHNLIRALKKVAAVRDDVRLVIVGHGDYRDDLEALVDELGVRDCVEFKGFLKEQEELVEYMRSCFAYVLPSLTEGLPRVIIEAMSCEKPVIATDVGGIPELIEEGVNGFLVKPDDPGAIADRLLQLLDDPDLAVTMGKKGRKFAEENFSSLVYSKSYAGMINRAMDFYHGKQSA